MLSTKLPGYPQKTESYPQKTGEGDSVVNLAVLAVGAGWKSIPGMGVWIVHGGAVESSGRSLSIVIEMLAQSQHFAPEFDVLFNQFSDAFTSVDDGTVIASSQHSSNAGQRHAGLLAD